MTATITLISFIMIAVTVHTCTGSPLLAAQVASEARGDMSVPQVHRGAQSGGARPERFAPLPEDQRRFTSKQILQALSEIIQRDDCFADYQGWVDFGRRSTD